MFFFFFFTSCKNDERGRDSEWDIEEEVVCLGKGDGRVGRRRRSGGWWCWVICRGFCECRSRHKNERTNGEIATALGESLL